MADSGAKSPKNPTFKDNNALARIVTLQRQFPGRRQDQYEEMVKREQAAEARKERDAEEAEQKRIARLEQEDADLAELEAKTKNASLSQRLFDVGYELVVPQDKMDWALLVVGGIGKVGKGSKIIKILDKEKALQEIAKKRKAVQEELRASQKAKKGTVVEKKETQKRAKKGPCDHLKKGQGKGDYRGGSHSETSKPRNDDLDSHHMPADDASPLAKKDGPAIQMEPPDHRETSSNGNNGLQGAAYRDEIQRLLANGEWRKAMAKEIRDVREIGKAAGDRNKYDEAIGEMLEYFKCLERHGLLK